MPQITKIRIVNVSYNGGHRLIPDELYDLSAEEGKKALHTLFTLSNGGGKSVLVQFLMQPVLPGAKASGRRIIEFFPKANDHCFVVLEWKLDGSEEKLLTGIAMAGSTGSEDTRGRQIRYYTFSTTYTDSSRYDIVHLNLSARKGNRFVPADFNDVRKWSFASNGTLQYFSRDERKLWKDTLKQYGIYQSVWDKVIQQLNIEEGGIIKFFDDVRTSEKLISKFFIPAIDARITDGIDHTGDASLRTMLMNYARRRYSQDEMIQRKALDEKILERTGGLQKKAESLFDLNEAKHEAEKDALAFSYGIEQALNTNRQNQEQLKHQVQTIQETITHIQYEKASADYYKAAEAYTAAQKTYEEAQHRQEDIHRKSEQVQREVTLLRCARYLQAMRNAEAERNSTQTRIDDLQGKSDQAEKLNNLQYTIHARTAQELPGVRADYQDTETSIQTKEKKKAQVKEETAQKQKQIREKENALHEEQARLDEYQKETDSRVTADSLPFQRLFDNLYHEEEIRTVIKKYESEDSRLQKQAETLQKALEKEQKEYHELPVLETKAEGKLTHLKESLDQAEADQKKYEQFLTRALEIGQAYNAGKDDLFSGHLALLVKQKLSEEESQYAFESQQIDKLNHEKEAAQKGTLHLLEEAVPLLKASGIAFETGEHYLLNAHDMTLESRQALLKQYPSLPYWLILDHEKDLASLKSWEQGKEWLPSAIPMMVRSQLTDFLNGSAVLPDFLSLYSHDFFENNAGFIENLQEEIQTKEEGQKIRASRIENDREEYEFLHACVYDASYEDGLKNKTEHLHNEIRDLENKLIQLQEEEAVRKEKIDSLTTEIHQNETAQQNQKQLIRSANSLLARIKEEISRALKVQEDKKQLQREQDEVHRLEDEGRKLEAELDTLGRKMEETSARLRSLEEASAATAKAKQGQLLEGDWEGLYLQYQKLQEKVSADLASLQKKREEADAAYARYKDLLAQENAESSAYESIAYTEEKSQEADRRYTIIRNELDQASRESETTGMHASSLHTKMESAMDQVHDYGETPLSQNEIGSDFDKRLHAKKSELDGLNASLALAEKTDNMLENAETNASELIGDIHTHEEITAKKIPLEKKALNQVYQQVRRHLKESRDVLRKADQDMRDDLRDCLVTYHDADQDILQGYHQISAVIENETEGDRYFTASTQLGEMMHALELLIRKLQADLQGIDDDRTHLIEQCMQQGKTVFENLLEIADSSRVKLEDEGKPRQMITLNLPDRKGVNAVRSEQLISQEIDQVTDTMRDMFMHEDQDAYQKAADQAVSSMNLLHLYTDQREISVKVYKIDFDERNSSYRTWEKARTENSGAEKFVAYFTAVLALMRYTGNSTGFHTETSGVLILDNPFGQITSAHLLDPTFRIAEHFHIQLICFSDITKADVVNCFDHVIRLVIREQPGSSSSVLTHEGNERIEHGYYKSYRQSLF